MGLHNSCQQRKRSRRGKSQRTIAPELGRLRYLAANVPYVDERSIEISHEHEIPLTRSLRFAMQSVKILFRLQHARA